MGICAKGLDAIAFLLWFRLGGAMCRPMANEYRNTGVNILKENPTTTYIFWGNRLTMIFYFFF